MTFGLLAGCQEPPAEAPFVFADRIASAEASFNSSDLRTLGEFESLSALVTLTTPTAIVDTRRALVAATPGKISYRVPVPLEPVLTFSIAAYMNAPTAPEPIRYRVLVESDGDTETVFEETVTFQFRDRWRDQEVNLSKWAGQTVELAFDSQFTKESSPSAERPLALWGDAVLTSHSWTSPGPTLVLISLDCLRADHVGTYGYERATTPHLDRLAEDGIVFENAWSTSSWTLPSHVSMMTGKLPSIHGVSDRWRKIYGSLDYFPDRLSRADYDAHGVVTFTLVSQAFGFEKGFRSYRTLHERPAEAVVDEALALMSRGQGRNKFLFMHLFDAHDPYYPPDKELWARFGPRPKDMTDLLDKVNDGTPPSDSAELQEVINLYDAEIVYLDRHLGRFFDTLKERGLYDDSLIVVTADHGEGFYEHGHWTHVVSLYEEVVRVPLIVKWPGSSPRGRVGQPVSLIDIAPTFLAAVGLEPTKGRGVNLHKVAMADTDSPANRVILSEIRWGPLGDRGPWPPIVKFAVRLGDLKYMATFEKPARDDLLVGDLLNEELYDLSADATERNNLLTEGSSRARPLRRWLRDYLNDASRRDPLPPDGEVELPEEEKERLRALGYIGR